MIKYCRLLIMFVACLVLSGVVLMPSQAYACSDCTKATRELEERHRDNEDTIVDYLVQHFHEIRDFIYDEYFAESIMPAMQEMTQHLSTAAMNQTFIIGTFFDAKQQLGACRNFETLKFEAHKDYQPSQGFCAIGTNARSLVHSDLSARQNAHALNRLSMLRATNNDSLGAPETGDSAGRWERFTRTHCDARGSGWIGSNVCKAGIDPQNMNKDVDFTAALNQKRTLDVNFTNTEVSSDENTVSYTHLTLPTKA